ncbi:MAG: phage tail protein [Chitinophaga sp.]|uniref:type VI secretion system tube protein TssD n=1 Tax=Chitinophaga sp. TaxID=1869181 RepID=UPI0025BBACFA|nr:type VI secretion system tube protein TssD [Chitinophaga sp.]MBV8253240.1 phage tail protein [Chitinophaga sp.]
MSFKSILMVNGEQYNVQHVSYELHQETDATGRPSAITRGGRIEMTVESTGKTDLFEWMVNNFERKDGTITFFKRDTDAKLKSLEFKEGYLVKFEEVFDYADKHPMTITFTISAREMSMGNASHINEWV